MLELLSLTYIALGEYQQAGRMCELGVSTLPAKGDLLSCRSNLYLNMGCCLLLAGKPIGGLRAGVKGLSHTRRASPVQHAVAVTHYGMLCSWADDFLGAQHHFDKAHQLVTQGQVGLYASWIANCLAETTAELGDYGIANERAEESLRHAEESPYYPEDLLFAKGTVGQVLLGLGEVEAAVLAMRRCADAASRAGDRQVEAEAASHWSSCARTDGHPEQAALLAGRAVSRAPATNVPLTAAVRLSHAAALIACGDLQAATAELRDIAKITRKPGFGRSEAWRRWLKADIARRTGRMHHCDQHLAKALSIARQNRYVHLMIVEGRITPDLLVRALEAEIETEFACEILSRIGPWLLPHAKALLNSDDPRLILLGIRILNDSGRSWARGPLLDAVRHKDPQMSKVAAEALARLPVQQEDRLRVTAFGNFEVVCGEREVMWRKRKAKHLMEYLFVNRRRKVPKDVLIDTFWPDSSLSAAVNNFYVTFHALKRSLNPHLQRREQLPYFTADDNMFQLVAETFSSDVDDFVTALAQAKRHRSDGQTEEAISMLRRCEELYTGDLMEDNLYEDWTAQDRQELREAYFDAMGLLAQLLSSTGENEQSVRVLRRLASKDKTREDLHLMIAEQYVKLGNRALAARQRKLCERALSEELGVDVSPEIHEAFEALLAATPA